MNKYRCSQCGETYSFNKYRNLEDVSRVTDDPNDKYGVEPVCEECGARFHSEKWTVQEEIEVGEGTIEVSTVALTIPHGPDHNHWYETCLFHDTGSEVVERYGTQDEAEAGHAEIAEKIKEREFGFEPDGQRIVLD